MSSPTDTFGGNGGTPRGANYVFGFLVTFVGLLIIFIACGLCSRRRLAERREAALFDPLRRHPNGKLGVGEGPPQLYDPLFVRSEDNWSALMPLSIKFWRENEKEKEKEKESYSVEPDSQALPPTTTSARRSFRDIFGRIFSSFHRNHKNPSLPAQTDPDPPDTIQVAVMIAMPSYNQSNRPEHLPEYQIGEINLPWKQSDHTSESIATGNS